jgi:hypothetical protein
LVVHASQSPIAIVPRDVVPMSPRATRTRLSAPVMARTPPRWKPGPHKLMILQQDPTSGSPEKKTGSQKVVRGPERLFRGSPFVTEMIPVKGPVLIAGKGRKGEVLEGHGCAWVCLGKGKGGVEFWEDCYGDPDDDDDRKNEDEDTSGDVPSPGEFAALELPFGWDYSPGGQLGGGPIPKAEPVGQNTPEDRTTSTPPTRNQGLDTKSLDTRKTKTESRDEESGVGHEMQRKKTKI